MTKHENPQLIQHMMTMRNKINLGLKISKMVVILVILAIGKSWICFAMESVENCEELPIMCSFSRGIPKTLFEKSCSGFIAHLETFKDLYGEASQNTFSACFIELEKLSLNNSLIFRAENKYFYDYFKPIQTEYGKLFKMTYSDRQNEDVEKELNSYIEEKKISVVVGRSSYEYQIRSIEIILIELQNFHHKMQEAYFNMNGKPHQLIKGVAESIKMMCHFSREYTPFLRTILVERSGFLVILNNLWCEFLDQGSFYSYINYPALYECYEQKAEHACRESQSSSSISNTTQTTTQNEDFWLKNKLPLNSYNSSPAISISSSPRSCKLKRRSMPSRSKMTRSTSDQTDRIRKGRQIVNSPSVMNSITEPNTEINTEPDTPNIEESEEKKSSEDGIPSSPQRDNSSSKTSPFRIRNPFRGPSSYS